jgi:excisionase family DNA binding protein
MEPELRTESEICNILSLSRTTLASLRQKGMPHLRLGNSIRYELDKVMKWLYDQSSQQKGETRNGS